MDITTWLKMPNVAKATGKSPSTIYRWINNGEFPPPVQMGPGSSGWQSHVYEEWATDPQAWVKNNKNKKS